MGSSRALVLTESVKIDFPYLGPSRVVTVNVLVISSGYT